jgi:hypothetical protein
MTSPDAAPEPAATPPGAPAPDAPAPDAPAAEAPGSSAREPVLPEQSPEDTDAAWGEYPRDDDRLYRDRPPHWDDI